MNIDPIEFELLRAVCMKVIVGEELSPSDFNRLLVFLRLPINFTKLDDAAIAAMQVRLRSLLAERYGMTPRPQ